MRKRWAVGGGFAVIVGAIYLANASWLAAQSHGTPVILAHRGVHQTFPQAGLTRDSCTANRINPPINPFLENTIPSMKASFAAGATALELDIHPTTDGEFAVFHDWTVDCRTNGHGVTREQSMATLKGLDVGYGYTADGGKSYPFRGKGIGLMPTLNEVLTTFPDKQFMINIKSNDPSEVDRMLAYLKKHGRPTDERLWVLADRRPAERLVELAPRARLLSKRRVKDCAYKYIALGWSGYVPQSCRTNIVVVPLNMRWAMWGWPNRFLARMRKADATVMLIGPLGKDQEPGLSDPSQLDAVPRGFDGIIWTDHIEKMGPAARKRWAANQARPVLS